MRVLVTGSRDWLSRSTVWDALGDLAESTGTAPRDMVVVHGACPTGADHDAWLWSMAVGAKNEPHEADWAQHGRRAGPIRNRKMVRLGADLCLAFSRVCTSDRCEIIAVHGSHGTAGCIGLARQWHIPVTLFTEGY